MIMTLDFQTPWENYIRNTDHAYGIRSFSLLPLYETHNYVAHVYSTILFWNSYLLNSYVITCAQIQNIIEEYTH